MLQRICNDPALCGHRLITLPSSLWNAAIKAPLLSYTPSTPGFPATRSWLIFENYTQVTHHNNGGISVTLGTNILPAKYLELTLRYLLGFTLGMTLCFTAVPIGGVMNMLHLLSMNIHQLGMRILTH